MKRNDGRAARSGNVLLVTAVVFAACVAARADQPDETLPFFRPDGVYDTSGIDSVNLFSGDTGVVIPLGPEYLLGPTTRWQLKAHNTAKFWHYSRSCYRDPTAQFAYVSGDPTLGVGWTLSPGFVEKTIEIGAVYWSPDGSPHRTGTGTGPWVTTDGSHLRIRALPDANNPASYVVEFPDGSTHVFGQRYAPPGGPFDFRTWDYGASPPARFGLTEVDDAFGNKVLEVAYTDPSHPAEFSSFRLAGSAFGAAAPAIAFSWTTFAVNAASTWRVLDSILFPAPGGTRLKAKFFFQVPIPTSGTGFLRNSFDLPSPNCSSPPSSPSTADVPELAQIQISDAPTADLSTKTFSYFFSYYQAPSTDAVPVQKQGTLAAITLPSQQAAPTTGLATIRYDYGITGGLRQIVSGSCEPYGCDATSPDREPELPAGIAKYSMYLDKSPAVTSRTEFDPFRNASSTVSYQREGFFVYDTVTGSADTKTFVRRVTVARPGNDDGTGASQYVTQHFFHAAFMDEGNPQDGSNGVELERRDFDGPGTRSPNRLVRDVVSCYGSCGFEDGNGAVRRIGFTDRTPPSGAVTWFGQRPAGQDGGSCSTAHAPACTAVTSSVYNAVAGKYERTSTVSTLPGGVSSTTDTDWTAASTVQTEWLLDLYTHRFSWDGAPASPPSGSNGSTVVRQYFDFDPTSGFLRASWTWDSAQGNAIKDCRYNGGAGVVSGTFTQTYPSPGEPTASACPGSMPSIPSDSDTFGKTHAWTNLLPTRSSWQAGFVSIGWNSFDVVRDASTGLITTSRDANAGLATTYTYDRLGRIVMIQPPGGSSVEWPTTVCYSPSVIGSGSFVFTPLVLVKKLTANPTLGPGKSACASDEGVPSASSGTFEGYLFDGLGRPVREIHRMNHALATGSYFAMRETRYDSAGHRVSRSEWQPCALNGYAATSIAGCTKAQAESAKTVWSRFDPYGRSEEIRGVNGTSVSSDVVIDRTDDRVSPSIRFSDSKEKSTTKCVNGAWSAGACTGSGKIDSVTVIERDALGREIQVTEPDPLTGSPSADTTSYAYNVLDKLVQVTQGAQVRTFSYSAFGFLKDETTPENGIAGKARTDYTSYGSLGNLLAKKDGSPSSTQYNYTYDPAGRLTLLTTGTSASTTYLVQCYDGTGTCGDATIPNSAGGSSPKGKLTRRLGWNLIPLPAAPVYDDYVFSGPGGRLSARTTSIGARGAVLTATGFGAPVTQSWTYNVQGRMASHAQPRAAGSSTSLTVNDADYTSGSLTRVTASWQGGSQQLVTANYHESGRLADYSTGSLGAVRTTISPDGLVPSRPGQISASTGAFSTGTFAYDGAGNIKSLGSSDTFSYDARSRITQARYGSPTQSFTYDRYGNLLTRAGATFCAGTCANNRITGAVHDDRGNMTVFGSETLAHDLLNRQVAETNGSSDYAYLYDGEGERVGKFPRPGGALRREIAHDIIEARGDASLSCTPNPFLDVACSSNPNDGKYVQKLKDLGITSGCGGGNFCPDATIPREQAAVFLVLGKHCPVGSNGCSWTPPPCAGRFADVPCPSTFAAWIEQLSNDGVTSGCGGGNFCPSSPLTPWQMLVWLKVYWPAYNPLPRGTILTFRDENGRVTTEAHQASATGDASDSVVYERDNVFLGHQLVASAIWNGATPGWQFYSSDHLGTPRLTTNNAGATIETRKYWPYGDEASSSGNAVQRLKFASMERDDEANHFYDHARNHDFNLGRFTSPDKVGGRPSDPQSWNRYSYALSNPMKHIDPDGNLTIVLHGTGARGNGDFLPGGTFFQRVVQTVPDRSYVSFQWSGANNHAARLSAARSLAAHIRSYPFSQGEPLNIIGHSHGGNVAILGVNLGLGRPVSNLVTLGAPSRAGYHVLEPSSVQRFVNVFNSHDQVQKHGGGDYSAAFEVGPAAQTQPFALNLNWNVDNGALGSHSSLHTPSVWNFVVPHLKKDTESQPCSAEIVWNE